jgi:hypothetical protein
VKLESSVRERNARGKNAENGIGNDICVSTQELYKHNPSVLAKHIRDGTNWLEDRAPDVPREDVHNFYAELWGLQLNAPTKDRPEVAAYTTISTQDLKARIHRLKTENAPGRDGIAKKSIAIFNHRGPAAPI